MRNTITNIALSLLLFGFAHNILLSKTIEKKSDNIKKVFVRLKNTSAKNADKTLRAFQNFKPLLTYEETLSSAKTLFWKCFNQG